MIKRFRTCFSSLQLCECRVARVFMVFLSRYKEWPVLHILLVVTNWFSEIASAIISLACSRFQWIWLFQKFIKYQKSYKDRKLIEDSNVSLFLHQEGKGGINLFFKQHIFRVIKVQSNRKKWSTIYLCSYQLKNHQPICKNRTWETADWIEGIFKSTSWFFHLTLCTLLFCLIKI